jgi:high-affinity nickel permease
LGVYLQIEKIYIFFPNILEWFFMLSILLPNQKLEYNLIIATGISLFVEYIIHINNFHLISKYIHHREIIWAKNEPKKKSKSIKK